jgi:CheY-like chemotaxis protein
MEVTMYEVLPKTKPGRILVVDDDPDFRSMVGIAFTRAGFTVWEAMNGNDALAIMPEADGYEVILKLKSLSSQPPLIAVSGGSARLRMELPNMARLLGADAAFEKPVDLAALLKEATRLIDGHHRTASPT